MWKSTIFLTLILSVSSVLADQVCLDTGSFAGMIVGIILGTALICIVIAGAIVNHCFQGCMDDC
jgi:hypothetical protein